MNGELKYPDHYALKLCFKNIPIKHFVQMPCKTETIFNTHKINGWQVYKEKTETNDKLEYVAKLDRGDPEFLLGIVEKETTKIKYASFGKVKVYSKPKTKEN